MYNVLLMYVMYVFQSLPQNRQALFQFVQKNIQELPKTKRADAIVDLGQYFHLKLSDEMMIP